MPARIAVAWEQRKRPGKSNTEDLESDPEPPGLLACPLGSALTPVWSFISLMGQHGESGMKFAGKVTQLITAAMGLDDWEWGVTLWARNPEFLKEIVYRMRFDEASARYAEFGPFYVGYLATAAQILAHCRVGSHDWVGASYPG